MKYRIMIATSGSYYVQRRDCCGEWKKFGQFFRSKAGARTFIYDLQEIARTDRVVEYY